jgi:hypothetical protein
MLGFMSEPARPHPGADMEGFVSLADAEIETIRRTAPRVLKHGAAITAARAFCIPSRDRLASRPTLLRRLAQASIPR